MNTEAVEKRVKMSLNNFDSERSKHLYIAVSNAVPSDSMYLAVCRKLYGDSIMKEKGLKTEAELVPFLREKLKKDFYLPEKTNSHFLSMFTQQEEELLACEGNYSERTFKLRQAAVKRLYDQFVEHEKDVGRSDDDLIKAFLNSEEKMTERDPTFRDTIRALGKEDLIEGRKELHKVLLAKGDMKEDYEPSFFEKSPTKLRFEKCSAIGHPILPTSDEGELDQNEDLLDSLIFSPLSLNQLYFITANAASHSFSCNILGYHNSKIYTSIMGVGAEPSSRKPPRKHCVNLFKIAVKVDNLQDGMSPEIFDSLLNSNQVNQNLTKTAIEEFLTDSETPEQQEVRRRANLYFGKNPRYKLDKEKTEGIHNWKLNSQQQEIKNTCFLFFAVSNLDLFMRHTYEDLEGNKKGTRECVYCQKCHDRFFSVGLRDQHEATCRSRATVTR